MPAHGAHEDAPLRRDQIRALTLRLRDGPPLRDAPAGARAARAGHSRSGCGAALRERWWRADADAASASARSRCPTPPPADRCTRACPTAAAAGLGRVGLASKRRAVRSLMPACIAATAWASSGVITNRPLRLSSYGQLNRRRSIAFNDGHALFNANARRQRLCLRKAIGIADVELVAEKFPCLARSIVSTRRDRRGSLGSDNDIEGVHYAPKQNAMCVAAAQKAEECQKVGHRASSHGRA